MAHISPITCVDHHIEGNFRVTGGYDGRVVAWNADNTERWTESFDDLVNDVRIDPSGSRIAVAAADRFAFVLDARDGSRIDGLGPHGDDVNAVRWSPNGDRLACVMDHLDTSIYIWERQDGGWLPLVLEGHESGVFAVAFDPSGSRLATVAEDSTARIWDIASGSQLHVLRHPGDPEALDWSPDGKFVVTGCDDGIARVWNPDDGSLVRELTDAEAAVRFIRFDQHSERLLAGAYDATMRVYECKSWTLVDSLHGAFQWERSGAFTRSGIVVGSFGAQPIEHLSSPQYPSSNSTHNVSPTFGINSISATRGHLFVGRDDGAVVDVLRGVVVSRHDTIVNTVATDPQGMLVASGNYRGGIHLTPLVRQSGGVAAPSLGSVNPIATRAADGGPINSIVWHPSGERFFSGGYDGAVRVWLRNGDCVSTFSAHHGPIKSLAWSESADLLVAGSSDGSLSGWRDEKLVWRASADDLVLVNAVATADEVGTVVSASRDLRVRVWDAATGALLESLPIGHLKSVKAISVNANGETIVTGSYDGTAIVWSRRDSAWRWRVLRLHGKPGVPAVALCDGNIFTAGWNGSVGRWALDGRLTTEYPASSIN